MGGERIVVVPYDPDWPRRFETERALLAGGARAVARGRGSTTSAYGSGKRAFVERVLARAGLAPGRR